MINCLYEQGTEQVKALLGLLADAVHFCICRPIYGKRGYQMAKRRWTSGGRDFRLDGVL